MNEELDLLLVNAGGTKRRIYQDLSKDYSAVEPPFWAALLAGFIRNKGFKVKILDANAENLDMEDTEKKIEELNPKLVSIVVYGQNPSASTSIMPGVSQLCSEMKKRNTERKIILVGLHPSALPERTIKEEKCDYVCEGEGFYTILGLVQNKKLEEIQGLWWKENKKIRNNPRALLIENLTEELPDVAWDLLPMDKYKAHNWHCFNDLNSRMNYAALYTSLGCPFNCTFCCINTPFKVHKYRTWNSEWVMKQIDILVNKYNVKNLKIIDELFVFKSEHFIPIAEKIIEKDYKLNIWAYARIDTLKEKNLELLKKAGFNWLAIGIESANKKIRQNSVKGSFGEDDIRTICKKIKDAGISIGGNYIFGLPLDTMETMQETYDLAKELNCEWTNFFCAMAYPGSKLYEECKKKGIPLPDDPNGAGWIGYSQYAYETLPLPTETLSSAEVLRFRDEAFHKFYTSPDYLNMIEKKFGIEARKHVEEMTKTRLKRKILGD